MARALLLRHLNGVIVLEVVHPIAMLIGSLSGVIAR
jgi:hypothetical protein